MIVQTFPHQRDLPFPIPHFLPFLMERKEKGFPWGYFYLKETESEKNLNGKDFRNKSEICGGFQFWSFVRDQCHYDTTKSCDRRHTLALGSVAPNSRYTEVFLLLWVLAGLQALLLAIVPTPSPIFLRSWNQSALKFSRKLSHMLL